MQNFVIIRIGKNKIQLRRPNYCKAELGCLKLIKSKVYGMLEKKMMLILLYLIGQTFHRRAL